MIIPVQCLLLSSCDECFAFPFPAITILSWYQSHPLSVCGTCRIGDCPSIVFAPRFLSSSPHHQVGSVWLIHSARHRSSVCSWCFILGSSPRGTGQGGEPLHVSQGALLSAPLFSGPSVPSILIILLLFENFWLHFSTWNDILICPADGSVSQCHASRCKLAYSVMSSVGVADGYSTSDICWWWCRDWGGRGL